MTKGSLLSVAIIEVSEKYVCSSYGEKEVLMGPAPHYPRAPSPVCEFPGFMVLLLLLLLHGG